MKPAYNQCRKNEGRDLLELVHQLARDGILVLLALFGYWTIAHSSPSNADAPSSVPLESLLGAPKINFLADMQSRYGAKDWKCRPEGNSSAAESCWVEAIRASDSDVNSRWMLETARFRALAGTFEKGRLFSFSFVLANRSDFLEFRHVRDSLTARLGQPASVAKSDKVGDWLAYTWVVGPNSRILLLDRNQLDVEVMYAPTIAITRRFGEQMAAAILRPTNTNCEPGAVNLCNLARQASNEFAKELPIQLDRDMRISRVAPAGAAIIFYIDLSYTNEQFDQRLRNTGTLRSRALDAMTEATRDSLCKTNSAIRSLLEQGVRVQYQYRGSDGKLVAQLSVDSC